MGSSYALDGDRAGPVGAGADGGRGLQPCLTPLTLADALAFTRSDMPLIELAQAGREENAAALAEAQSLTGLRMGVVGRLRAIDPARAIR